MGEAFKKNLLEIQEEINSASRDKVELFSELVNDRLNNALSLYRQNLEEACNYLLSRNCLITMKQFTYKVVEKGVTKRDKLNK